MKSSEYVCFNEVIKLNFGNRYYYFQNMDKSIPEFCTHLFLGILGAFVFHGNIINDVARAYSP